jgi:hypothetical protein
MSDPAVVVTPAHRKLAKALVTASEQAAERAVAERIGESGSAAPGEDAGAIARIDAQLAAFDKRLTTLEGALAQFLIGQYKHEGDKP